MERKFHKLNALVLGSKDVEVLRVGILHDRGLKITQSMLNDLALNFASGVFGAEIAVNLKHKTGSEAAGWIKNLFVDSDKLMATIEWTELGQNMIEKKLYKYVSAEFWREFPDPKSGKLVKNVFTGLALTNFPALKDQNPLELNHKFNKKNMKVFQKLLEKLEAKTNVSMGEFQALELAFEAEKENLEAEDIKGYDEKMAALKQKCEEYEAKLEAAQKEMKELQESAKKTEKMSQSKNEAEVQLEMVNKEKVELQARLEKLEAESAAVKLEALIKEKVALSNANPVGFAKPDLEKVSKFMATLTFDQQNTFIELCQKVRGVTLGAVGSDANNGEDKKNEKDSEAKAEEIAAKLMERDKGMTKLDAMTAAYKSLLA